MVNSPADKSFPLPLLIASEKHIKAAWKESRDARGAGGAPGIDRVTPEQFRRNFETNVKNLSKKLKAGTYRFQKLKPNFIPKGDGKFRVICVPTVEDRLAQRLILRSLVLDKNGKARDRLDVTTPISFGIRKGSDQGVHAAIERAILLRRQRNWVLKTDISQFFDRIPRKELKNFVRARLGKSSLIPLLEQVIDTEISAKDDQSKQIAENGIQSGLGLRQGMPLSPLLSNLILNKFDRKIHKAGLNVIRYADDIIGFFDTEDECRAALKVIIDALKKLDFSVPPLEKDTKTFIVPPEDPVLFLGVEIYKPPSETYMQRVPQDTISEGYSRVQLHADLKANIKEGYTYSDVMSRLQSIPSGYAAAFKGCTNLPEFVAELRCKSIEVQEKLIADVIGKEAFAVLSDDHKKFLGF